MASKTVLINLILSYNSTSDSENPDYKTINFFGPYFVKKIKMLNSGLYVMGYRFLAKLRYPLSDDKKKMFLWRKNFPSTIVFDDAVGMFCEQRDCLLFDVDMLS